MIEKFSDYETTQFLNKTGEFVFTITNAELTTSNSGYDMVKLTATSDAGQTTLRHVLKDNCKWSYNRLIAACLKLTDEQKKTFTLNYSTIHNELIGKQFVGVVEQDSYLKDVKIPLDDGTFENGTEEVTSYKVTSYKAVGE